MNEENKELFKQALVEGVNNHIDKTIEKAKQIEEIARVLCGMGNGCDGCIFNKLSCFEYNDAETIYNAGYRKQSEGEWISVEDGLPEEDGVYITFTNARGKSNGVIAQSLVTRTIRGNTIRRWEWQTKVSPWIVTHWMPLPEAPKMKGGE